MSKMYSLKFLSEFFASEFFFDRNLDMPSSDILEEQTLDRILAPKKAGDVLIGREGEADRFRFEHPDQSPNLTLRLDQGTIDLEDKTQLYWNGYPIKTEAVRVLKFDPKEGDVLDFSGLPAKISVSGHTPKAHSVWVGELDNSINHYPVYIDLDGDPRSIEMGIFLAPTPEDLEPIGPVGSTGKVLTSQMISMDKTVTEDMFLLPLS